MGKRLQNERERMILSYKRKYAFTTTRPSLPKEGTYPPQAPPDIGRGCNRSTRRSYIKVLLPLSAGRSIV